MPEIITLAVDCITTADGRLVPLEYGNGIGSSATIYDALVNSYRSRGQASCKGNQVPILEVYCQNVAAISPQTVVYKDLSITDGSIAKLTAKFINVRYPRKSAYGFIAQQWHAMNGHIKSKHDAGINTTVLSLPCSDYNSTQHWPVIYQRMQSGAKRNVSVVDGAAVAHAITENKVLSWLWQRAFFDKKTQTHLPVTQLFGLRDIETQQQRLNDFLALIKSEKVILKPTNSTLVQGQIVLPRDRALLQDFFSIFKAKNKQSLASFLATNLPEAGTSAITAADITKFINYWTDKKYSAQGYDNEYFLLQEYYQPQPRKMADGKNYSAPDRLFVLIIKDDEGKIRYDILDGCSKMMKYPESLLSFALTEGLKPENLTKVDFVTMDNMQLWKTDLFDMQGDAMAILFNPSLTKFIGDLQAKFATDPIIAEYLQPKYMLQLDSSKLKICVNCNRVKPKMPRCTVCNKANYCSSACQKQQWDDYGHKEWCSGHAAPKVAAAGAAAEAEEPYFTADEGDENDYDSDTEQKWFDAE